MSTTTVTSNNGTQATTERYLGNRTIIEYKVIEYKGRWNEIKCTLWIWICAILCTLYIVVGIPLLKYLNRSDDETEEVTKEVTKVHFDTTHHTMYIRNLIAKSLAISNSAFKSSRLM